MAMYIDVKIAELPPGPALQHPRPYRRYRGWAERSRCQENVPTLDQAEID